MLDSFYDTGLTFEKNNMKLLGNVAKIYKQISFDYIPQMHALLYGMVHV